MNSIDLLFPTPIYRADNIISKEYKDELINLIYDIKSKVPSQDDKWFCKIYTSYSAHDLKYSKDFFPLFEAIQNHLYAFISELESTSRPELQGAWVNIAKKGDFQEHHRHQGAAFSAVYYLQAPEGSGDLLLENPAGFMPELDNIVNNNILNSNTQSYTPIDNSLIIFRSHIQHMVLLGKNEKDRISIALNFR